MSVRPVDSPRYDDAGRLVVAKQCVVAVLLPPGEAAGDELVGREVEVRPADAGGPRCRTPGLVIEDGG